MKFCLFIDIVWSITWSNYRYLIEQGCNLAAVNNDGELALDIAESDEMEEMLQQHITAAGNILIFIFFSYLFSGNNWSKLQKSSTKL